MAGTLTDIVYRRLMLGLDAEQGGPHYEAIADIAASEFDWDERRRTNELHVLKRYSDSFRVAE